MRVTEYSVSWKSDRRSEGHILRQIHEDLEDAEMHIKRLLSMKKKNRRVSDIKLQWRYVTRSNWKKVVRK